MVRFLLRELPYVAVLGLALVGVAYSNFSGRQINGFWEFLAIAMGIVCVLTALPEAQERETRLKLIGTQAAHWATIGGDDVSRPLADLPAIDAGARGRGGALDVAGARRSSRADQSPLRQDLLSRRRHGAVRSGARLAKQASLLLVLVGVAAAGLAIVF
jgi:hypothetical protein